MKKSLFILLILFPCVALAQGYYTLRGMVSDGETNEKLPNANVLLYSDINKLLKFTTTDKDGTFQMSLSDSLIGKSYIKVSFIGYKTLQKRIDGSNDWKLVLTPKATIIKEVIVKAPKIKAQGDTLVYDVRQFAKEGDRSIGDVLRRMPGIQTNESGQISYNGKPINRFYIENSDLLEGRYGIATNNISNAEVGSVEILQNHQPVKALEGIAFSEQAAINLRLKEGAKHKWIGTLRAYAGMSSDEGLWNGQGTFMRFTRKSQSLNTLKSNNTGEDTSKELRSFDVNEVRNRRNLLPDYVDVIPPYSMGLNRDRELMNITHQLTSHNLFKLKNGGDVKVSLTYQHHAEEAYKETESVYYEDGQKEWVVSDTEEGKFTHNALMATFSTERNESTYNLSERFSVNMDWKERDIFLNGQQDNIQDLYGGSKKLVNNLYLLKRNKNQFYNLSSYTVFHSNPQNIRVQAIDRNLEQKVNPVQFFTDNNLGWGAVWGKMTLDFTANLSGLYRDLETNLSGFELDSLPMSDDLVLGYIKTGIIPKMTYQSSRFKSVLTLPLNYYHYRYKEQVSKDSEHQVSLSPSLYAELYLSSRWKVYMRGSFGKQPVNVQNFYPSFILKNYRSLTQGLTDFSCIQSASANGGIEYNIPLSGFYSGIGITKMWTDSPYILSQTLNEKYVISSYQKTARKSGTINVSGNVSKDFEWARTTFILQGGWNRNDSYLTRNDAQVKNRQDIFYINPEVDMNPFSWLNLRYALSYNHITFSIHGATEKEKTSTLEQSLSVRMIPSSKLNFTLKGEHYANRMDEGCTRHFYLTDFMATYKFSNNFSLDCRLTNLFNEKEYAYTSFTNDAMRISRRYIIRPRNFLIGGYITF